MTKSVFQKLFVLFKTTIKQEVLGQLCMGASCRFVDYCGGYQLELRPNCLMWGKEFAILNSLAESVSATMMVEMDEGIIKIY